MLFTVLAGLAIFFSAAVVCYYLYIARLDGPPTVWPSVPFLGDTYQYLYDQTTYLEKCRLAYGPIFRCLLGNQKMIVICDGAGIQSVLRDKTRVLSTYIVHRGVASAVAKVGADVSHYLPDRLLPLTTEIFSVTDLHHILPALNRTLNQYVENIKSAAYNPQYLPLATFVGDGLYSAVSTGVFGAQFPVSTFKDFEEIDMNFANLMTQLPFLSTNAKRSRERMLACIGAYIDEAGPSGGAGTLPDPATKILNILTDLRLPTTDRNGMLMLFMWGLHSSTIRASFWLFAYLMNNPDALARLRTEIDSAVADAGGIDALLDAPHGKLDGPQFALLTSAVKEAIRASSIISPVREVCEDMVVTLSTGETFPIRKGESLTANIPLLHIGPGGYDDPLEFRLDRFSNKEERTNTLYIPWGSGEHICKGRWLAQHAIKMFVVLVLRSLELSPASSSGTPISAPFLTQKLNYMHRWQMRPHKPLSVCVRTRYSGGEATADFD
ncbi:cytochrome P450 [Trametopsis cervina]|nr:cytochrome P450 [Trametopsis cervina]